MSSTVTAPPTTGGCTTPGRTAEAYRRRAACAPVRRTPSDGQLPSTTGARDPVIVTATR